MESEIYSIIYSLNSALAHARKLQKLYKPEMLPLLWDRLYHCDWYEGVLEPRKGRGNQAHRRFALILGFTSDYFANDEIWPDQFDGQSQSLVPMSKAVNAFQTNSS